MKADEPSLGAKEIASAIRHAAIETDVLRSMAEAAHRHADATSDASTTIADALLAIAGAVELVAKALEGRKP